MLFKHVSLRSSDTPNSAETFTPNNSENNRSWRQWRSSVYELAPRIKDIKDQTLYKIDRQQRYPNLDPILSGTVMPHCNRNSTRIQRRARQAGIKTRIGNHSMRATGITDYLKSDGTLEHAQTMAAHSSPRTTKLYDRRNDETALDEYEKVRI